MQGYAKHITRLTLSIFSFLLDEYISKTKTKKERKKASEKKHHLREAGTGFVGVLPLPSTHF